MESISQNLVRRYPQAQLDKAAAFDSKRINAMRETAGCWLRAVSRLSYERAIARA